MKINWENNFKYYYNQAPKSGIQHVILNKDLKPLCNPFFCKEYFQDFIWAEKTKNTVNQYGLQYTPQGVLDSFYIGIRVENDSFKLSVPNIKNVITSLQRKLKIKSNIKIEEVENGILLSNFGEWTSNPIYSSILLQSLRHTNKFNSKTNIYKNLIEGSFNDNYKLQILNGWLPKLFLLEKGFTMNNSHTDWNSYKNSMSIHNTGLNNIQLNNLTNNKWN